MFRSARSENVLFVWFVFFFFQAEDGIRDDLVTGVQTCALPIFLSNLSNQWLSWKFIVDSVKPWQWHLFVPIINIGMSWLTFSRIYLNFLNQHCLIQ